jgi:predicted amidophosphoribosyltransferase
VIDEGPSSEDIDRFGGDVGYCTECGEEMSDLATHCPRCRAYLPRGPGSRPPVASWFQRRWVLLVVIAILLAFFIVYVL